jgi:hypothetical protein
VPAVVGRGVDPPVEVLVVDDPLGSDVDGVVLAVVVVELDATTARPKLSVRSFVSPAV